MQKHDYWTRWWCHRERSNKFINNNLTGELDNVDILHTMCEMLESKLPFWVTNNPSSQTPFYLMTPTSRYAGGVSFPGGGPTTRQNLPPHCLFCTVVTVDSLVFLEMLLYTSIVGLNTCLKWCCSILDSTHRGQHMTFTFIVLSSVHYGIGVRILLDLPR